MSDLFDRVWRLIVGDVEYEGADLRATARWPQGASPSTVDLTVYHPDPAFVDQIRAGTARVSVLAGYADAMGAVEIGGGTPVRGSIIYDRSVVDMPLSVQLTASGAPASVVLSAAWATVTAREVLAWIARESGLEIDDQSAAHVRYTRGYVIDGGWLSVVGELAADLGCSWDVDGATLRLWPADGVSRTTASLWSPSTGLERAAPAGDEGQIRAVRRLDPALRRGHLIRLISDDYAGEVRLLEAVHEVDTQGDTWSTTVVGVPR